MQDLSKVGYLTHKGTGILAIGFDGPYANGIPIFEPEFAPLVLQSLVSVLKPRGYGKAGPTNLYEWPVREGSFEFRVNREQGTVRCHIRAPRFMEYIKRIVDPLLVAADVKQNELFPTEWNVAPDLDMALDESFFAFLRAAETMRYFYFAAGAWEDGGWNIYGDAPAFTVRTWTVLDSLSSVNGAAPPS